MNRNKTVLKPHFTQGCHSVRSDQPILQATPECDLQESDSHSFFSGLKQLVLDEFGEGKRVVMKRQLITIFAGIILVAICAGTSFAKEISVVGRLQRTVEPGGWIISSTNQKYLILNSERFRNESWFSEATEVEAVGQTK